MKKTSLLFILLTIFGFNFLHAQDPTDEELIKQVIQNSFDDIFSNLDMSTVEQYYTDDFLLLEHGEIWTNDTIAAYLLKAAKRENRPKRINRFDFIKVEVTGDRAWVAYHNYADFFDGENQVGEMYWLESAELIRTDEGWKAKMLHSTRVKSEWK